ARGMASAEPGSPENPAACRRSALNPTCFGVFAPASTGIPSAAVDAPAEVATETVGPAGTLRKEGFDERCRLSVDVAMVTSPDLARGMASAEPGSPENPAACRRSALNPTCFGVFAPASTGIPSAAVDAPAEVATETVGPAGTLRKEGFDERCRLSVDVAMVTS